ncbi:unnamed protein product, partial [Thlaspi arvense]
CHSFLIFLPMNIVTELQKRIVMVEGVVWFGVQKLWELLSRESERLHGVHEEVAELKCQVRALQSLLKDAYARKNENERVSNFLEDVKDIVDDAEDTIESFLLKEFSGKEKGIKKRVKRLSCLLVDRRKISEVTARMQSFGIQHIMDSGHSLSLQERQRVRREIRQTFPNSSENNPVGVEQSVEKLVDQLVKNDNIQVVSITGMGGIGKTTLARQVFHHDTVRRHFDGFAWVCILQDFKRKDVWQRILQDLRPHDGDISQMDDHTLQGKLFQLLETSRYLIVIDDVWKNEDWDRIKAVFPPKRGKLICRYEDATYSRDEGVGLHADPTCFAFPTRNLTPEESWMLCESIVFPNGVKTEHRVDEELETMGKEMVTYCGGLPLAVKVLGGLLAKKYTVPEWKRVYDNLRTQIVGKPGLDDNNLNSVYRVLSLSYEDLPMQLKHSFLYLAQFPEDYKILFVLLFPYWAAEGIITPVYNGATIQEIGRDYLEELVRRNMVTIVKDDSSSIRDYCQMHDMMREVCLYKAKEENFLEVIKVSTSTSIISAHTSASSRRVVVYDGNALHLRGQKINKKARSVLCFGDKKFLCKKQSQGFRGLPFLRLLDLNNAKFEGGKLPSSIGELIHLRLLNLCRASVSHLPHSLRNLRLLLYLDSNVIGVVDVPNIFKEMRELRFLALPLDMDDKTKLEVGHLVNLETLWHFSTKHSIATDLLRMTKLRNLVVNFLGDYCTYETLSSYLCELKNLEWFGLFDFAESQKARHGEYFSLGFIPLKELLLVIHLPKFPDQFRFPPHLAHISLRYCRMEEDPMLILEKLLHLKSVVLLKDAFIGRRMVCCKNIQSTRVGRVDRGRRVDAMSSYVDYL